MKRIIVLILFICCSSLAFAKDDGKSMQFKDYVKLGDDRLSKSIEEHNLLFAQQAIAYYNRAMISKYANNDEHDYAPVTSTKGSVLEIRNK